MADEDNYIEAVEQTKELLTADPTNVDAHFRQGTAYFNLEEYVSAIQAFKAGLDVLNADPGRNPELAAKFAMWIRKCNTNLKPDEQVHADLTPAPAAAAAAPAPTPAPAPAPAPAPSVRHEWYQNHTHVILTFFAKDRAAGDVQVEFKKRALEVTIRLGGGKEFQHTLDPLYGEIDPAGSKHTLSATKVEVRLKKVAEGLQWKTLECAVGVPVAAVPAAALSQAPTPAYPSSKGKKDWDRLVHDIKKEEEEEKPEGDAALNKLFQDIFSKGDEKTRMAMQKSFLESGGTVLSTNWDEVGKKHVDGQPPAGMEFKKWA